MAKPDRFMSIELRAWRNGLSAWVDGRFLGSANVIGDKIIIEASMRQAIPDVILPEYLATGKLDR